MFNEMRRIYSIHSSSTVSFSRSLTRLQSNGGRHTEKDVSRHLRKLFRSKMPDGSFPRNTTRTPTVRVVGSVYYALGRLYPNRQSIDRGVSNVGSFSFCWFAFLNGKVEKKSLFLVFFFFLFCSTIFCVICLSRANRPANRLVIITEVDRAQSAMKIHRDSKRKIKRNKMALWLASLFPFVIIISPITTVQLLALPCLALSAGVVCWYELLECTLCIERERKRETQCSRTREWDDELILLSSNGCYSCRVDCRVVCHSSWENSDNFYPPSPCPPLKYFPQSASCELCACLRRFNATS